MDTTRRSHDNLLPIPLLKMNNVKLYRKHACYMVRLHYYFELKLRRF